jgi:hypothetical protein
VPRSRADEEQGDQIGQIFAYLVIVYFGQLLKKIQKLHKIFGALFTMVKVTYYFWEINGLGYILGDFFANSSGHPAQEEKAAGADVEWISRPMKC